MLQQDSAGFELVLEHSVGGANCLNRTSSSEATLRCTSQMCVYVCTMGLLIVPESHYTVPVLVSRCKEKKWVEGNPPPPFEVCCNKWNGVTVS